MRLKSKLIITILYILANFLFAQEIATAIANNDETVNFPVIDEYVQTLNNPGNTIEEAAIVICQKSVTQLEKARALFVWLSTFIHYDYSYKIHDAETAFIKRKGVCEGYSRLFCLMGNSVNLRTYYIIGYSKDYHHRTGSSSYINNLHAWNAVQCENRTVLLDACWGTGKTSKDDIDYYWWDVTPSIFIFTHFPSNSLNQCLEPIISAKTFSYMPYITPKEYTDKKLADDYLNNFLNKENQYVYPRTFNYSYTKYFQFEYINSTEHEGFFASNTELSNAALSAYLYETRPKQRSTSIIDSYKNDQEYIRKVNGKSYVFDLYPVTSISVEKAINFCNWLSQKDNLTPCYTYQENKYICDYNASGYRLPTVEEYIIMSARVDNDTTSLTDIAWYKKNNTGTICKSGGRKANHFGLYDVYGNVSELCGDNENGYAAYGGSVFSSEEECLSLNGINPNKNGVFNNTSIRLVRSIPKDAKELFYLSKSVLEKNKVTFSLDQYYQTVYRQNLKVAIDLLHKAAKAKSIDAQLLLAEWYETGKNVQQDMQKAYDLYLESTNAGSEVAAYKLYLFFSKKDNQFYNIEEATKYLYLAGSLEYSEAYTPLTELYRALSEMYPSLKEEFYQWLIKAAAANKSQYYLEAAQYYEETGKITGDFTYAFEYYLKLADKGDIESCKKVAEFYQSGKGTRINTYQAKKYCTIAADAGDSEALYCLGSLYLEDFYTFSDLELATSYFTKALECGLNATTEIKEKISKANELVTILKTYGNTAEEVTQRIRLKNYIPEAKEFISKLGDITEMLNSIPGCALNNPLLYTNFTLDALQTKIIKPLTVLYEGTEPYTYKNTLLVLLPSGLEELNESTFYTMTQNDFSYPFSNINGLKYKFDKSFYDHYDSILILEPQKDKQNQAYSIVFNTLKNCLSKTASLDIVSFLKNTDTQIFQKDSSVNSSFTELLQMLIDNGNTPRFIGLENNSSYNQTMINTILPISYNEKVKVFDIPNTLSDDLAMGFRNGYLYMFFTNALKNKTKTLLIYIIENGAIPKNSVNAETFVLSNTQITKMFTSSSKKSIKGSIHKNNKVVMSYEVVKKKK